MGKGGSGKKKSKAHHGEAQNEIARPVDLDAKRANFKEVVGIVPSLHAFAEALTSDGPRADELVQETLVRAWNDIESYDEEETELPEWLYAVFLEAYSVKCLDSQADGSEHVWVETASSAARSAETLRHLSEDKEEFLAFVTARGDRIARQQEENQKLLAQITGTSH